jgi:hypothetical protein
MVKLCNAGFTNFSSKDKLHQAYGVKLPVSAIFGHDAEGQEGWWTSEPVPINTTYILIL